MKNKALLLIFFVIILVSFLFVFYSIYNESTISSDESLPIIENSHLNKKKPESKQYSQTIQSKSKVSEKLLKKKGKQYVVDQTLRNPNSKDKSNQDFDYETKESEIVLIDGEKNEILSNYAVEIKYNYDDETIPEYKFITDKNGRFIFKQKRSNNFYFTIYTKDFAIFFTEELEKSDIENQYYARLRKSGILEIRATNKNNEIIEGLQINALPRRIFEVPGTIGPLVFDKSRGLYQISHLGGSYHFSFNAPGYQNSLDYRLVVVPNKIIFIEIILIPERKIIIDLDIPEKPKQIKFSEYNQISKANSTWTNRFDNLEANLNKNNLYECHISDQGETRLNIYVEGYISKGIKILPGKDLYFLPLHKSLECKIKVQNKKGEVIIGAEIRCGIKSYESELTNIDEEAKKLNNDNLDNQTVTTDENGLAKLKGLNYKMALELEVVAVEYEPLKTELLFDSKEVISKTIILDYDLKKISGKVKFGDKFVAGASVVLDTSRFLNGSNKSFIESDENGYFFFNSVDQEPPFEYKLYATHSKYGIATIQINGMTETNNIDLILKNEKSISLKISDIHGMPFAHQKISIDGNSINSIETNEKGECELFNITPGQYYIFSREYKFKVKGKEDNFVKIPSGMIEVTAYQKDFRKITAKLPSGSLCKGALKIFKTGDEDFLGNLIIHFPNGPSLTNKELLNKNGAWFIDVGELVTDNQNNESILIEVPGFSLIRLGRYATQEMIPKEFSIELQEGEKLKIKLESAFDNQPMPSVSVDLYIEKKLVSSLPTNNLGEVQMNNLNGNVTVKVSKEGFDYFSQEVDISQTKELLVKLLMTKN